MDMQHVCVSGSVVCFCGLTGCIHANSMALSLVKLGCGCCFGVCKGSVVGWLDDGLSVQSTVCQMVHILRNRESVCECNGLHWIG